DNPEALVILADCTEDTAEREDILTRALKYADDEELVFSVNFRLAHTFFENNKFTESLNACESAMKAADDPDDEDSVKPLYYRVLIELHEWQKILALTLRDETHGLAWGYSRLVAAWMTGGSRALCASMFWDALILAPDVPFYMFGYYPEPDDDEDHDDFDFAVMYYDIDSVSEDFEQWIMRGTILFGLLTNRFDGREREYVLGVLDALGGYEEYEKMSGILLEADDESVIEALAANKCLSD
ncbi:MAG: hypothetical protein IJG37_03675, partial [Synergistaceae bacterium]|nr:hypothetical protein [Synergistaceae bacterium]